VALFVGDALRTSDAGKPLLPPSMMTLDMEEAKASIRKMTTLEFSMLLPGHGPPIARDASKILKEFVAAGFR
jgi:glyoxylase-like metal-dependent hydrolase (beta-lactamase superfamily II)